jgi:hypothetical protein
MGSHEGVGIGSRCFYIRAGAEGPAGNVMLVKSYDDAAFISRRGEEIRLDDNYHPARCRGGVPTVRNIDVIAVRGARRVEVFNNKGRLAPGATRERDGSEIELRVRGVRLLRLIADRDRSHLMARTSAAGGLLVDLDRQMRAGFEADVTSSMPRNLRLMGAAGDDLIDASGLRRRSGIAIADGPGDDRIFGTDRGDSVDDGRGDDVIAPGPGDDYVRLTLGSDRVFLSSGSDWISRTRPEPLGYALFDTGGDRIFGGRGNDVFEIRNRFRDLLSCGRGRDTILKRDRRERIRPDCQR